MSLPASQNKTKQNSRYATVRFACYRGLFAWPAKQGSWHTRNVLFAHSCLIVQCTRVPALMFCTSPNIYFFCLSFFCLLLIQSYFRLIRLRILFLLLILHLIFLLQSFSYSFLSYFSTFIFIFFNLSSIYFLFLLLSLFFPVISFLALYLQLHVPTYCLLYNNCLFLTVPTITLQSHLAVSETASSAQQLEMIGQVTWPLLLRWELH
jgi:hypothetical protein